jgi:hypothetical protein
VSQPPGYPPPSSDPTQPGSYGYPPPPQPPPPASPYYPAGQYAPEAYPGGYQTYPSPKPYIEGTNGFAIASLVLGICGGAVLSIVFGIVALVQLRKRNQRGRGLAIAGISLSALWIVAGVTFVVIALVYGRDAKVGSSTTIDVTSTTHTVALRNLEVGQCVTEVTEGKVVYGMPVVACSQPHVGEVYATFDLPGGNWRSGVPDEAEQGCGQRLEDFSKKASQDQSINFYYFAPEERSWNRGEHGVVCLVVTPTPVTGSLKDS